METILNVKNVSKTYQGAGQTLTVLNEVNFTVEAGSTLSIVGPSGSGKTTLLGLCAGLDRASQGSVELNNIRRRIQQFQESTAIKPGSQLGYKLIIDFATRLGLSLHIDSEKGCVTRVTISCISIHHN